MKFSSFLKGGNRSFSEVLWGEQFIFMNLSPIPGAPLLVENDTSLNTVHWAAI